MAVTGASSANRLGLGIESLALLLQGDARGRLWLQNLQVNNHTRARRRTVREARRPPRLPRRPAVATTTSSSRRPPPQRLRPRRARSRAPSPISGYTHPQPFVARMMRRLDIVPWLAGVTLVSSSKTSVGAYTLFQFTIKASLVSPPANPSP